MKAILFFLAVQFFAINSFGHELHRRQLLQPFLVPESGKIKIAGFDADSTLRISKSGSPSANGADDYIILPGVAEKVRELNEQGFFVLIFSNQAGIPKFISMTDADGALFNMITELAAQGARFHYFDFAENKDEFRKPGVGMGLLLEKFLKEKFGSHVSVDKENSMYVGDSAYARPGKEHPEGEVRPDGRPGFNFSNTDRLFAKNYGVQFFEPQHFFGWAKYGVELIENHEHLDTLMKTISHSTTCRSNILKILK